jgi:hypothetical protein
MSAVQGSINLALGCTPGNIAVPIDSNNPHKLVATQTTSCQPKPSESLQPLALGDVVLICEHGEGSGSCDAGVCLQALPSNADALVCIVKPGGAACPESYPSRKQLVHGLGEAVDTRKCSTCTCGAPGTDSCSGTLAAYQSGDCGGSPTATQPIDGQCAIGWNTSASSLGVTLTGPTCPPSGGAAVGGVSPNGSGLTVCCVPTG